MPKSADPGEETPPRTVPFSARARADAWRDAQDGIADLLVIGGGITGVGIAHEAAGRGLNVVLVEAGDFAQGTSSRSSRLIHGGLRYLETYDFQLVFEALAERGRLVRLAPHLVRPLPFLYPVFAGSGVGMLKLRAGMWLYDALAFAHRLHSHRILNRRAAVGREPRLRTEGLRGAAVYYDGQVDDARLTIMVARAAHEAGALMIPHARMTDFCRGRDGAVAGVRVEDARSGAVAELRARLVVSAAGPWTDEIRALLDPAAQPRLRPTKGVHLQLRRDRIGNEGAITFRSPVDGRVMFVLPWSDFTYVGTTDTDYHGTPGDADAEPDDIEYVLKSINAIFPEAALTPEDVVSTWTGVRPLLAPAPHANRRTAGQTSREHEIWREPGGVVCIAGGKLTTFRVMARQTVDEAASILKREHQVETGYFATEHLPLPGAPDGDWELFLKRFVRRAGEIGMPAETARHLGTVYGTDAEAILEIVRQDPTSGERILAAHPHIRAEVRHAVRAEMALSLEDVLRRRLHLFYDSADGAAGAADDVARWMAEEAELGWGPADAADEVRRYLEVVRRNRASTGRAAVL